MRIVSLLLLSCLFAFAGNALAQSTPTAAPAAGSSFSASGTGGIDFELTLAPGATLANADIELADADNPGGGQVVTLDSITITTPPTGVTAPTAPTSGTAGNSLIISWTGTISAAETPGNYDYTINFSDDEVTPNANSAVIRIILTDAVPQGVQGTDATSGDGSGGNPFAPNSQVTGTTPALALADVTDANTGQTLTMGVVTPGGGNPSAVFTVTSNTPGAGGTLTLTATAGAALSAADVGTHTFAVPVDDGGANNITVNLSITVVEPVITIAAGTNPVEGGATGNFTLTATPAPSATITINFQLSGTADFGALADDYGVSGGNVMISTAQGPPGPWDGTIEITTSGTVDLDIVPADDTFIEGTETVICTLQAGTGYSVGTPSNDTLNLIDNDAIDATVTTSGTPAEPSTNGTFTINMSQNVATDTTVNFTVTGTATETTDYTLSSTATFTFGGGTGTIVIANGTSTADITLTVVDDATPESAESVTLTIDAGTGYAVGTPSNDTHNIADDDSINVSAAATGNPAEAGTVTGTYTLTASSAVPGDTTVNFTMSGSAAAGDYNLSSTATLNYTAPNGTIVIPNGNTSVTITLTPVDDATAEGTEDAILTINAGTGYTVGAPASATLNIADDDAAPAAASMSTGSGNPGNSNASPGSSRTVLVFRVTESGGGTDYIVTSVSADIITTNNTGGAAVNAVTSVSLRRGGNLATITNGGAGWSVAGDVITVDFTGLSSVVTAGSSADFSIVVSFSGASVPSPNPRFSATISPTDVNSGTGITGTTVNGGTITLIESLPDDPLDEEDDNSCDLSTGGGPAWPLLLVATGLVALALGRRRVRS